MIKTVSSRSISSRRAWRTASRKVISTMARRSPSCLAGAPAAPDAGSRSPAAAARPSRRPAAAGYRAMVAVAPATASKLHVNVFDDGLQRRFGARVREPQALLHQLFHLPLHFPEFGVGGDAVGHQALAE